jgi:hypothetical protein
VFCIVRPPDFKVSFTIIAHVRRGYVRLQKAAPAKTGADNAVRALDLFIDTKPA